MPPHSHGLFFRARIDRCDANVDPITPKLDPVSNVGLREPEAVEVARVNDSRECLAIGALADANVLRLQGVDEAVHRVVAQIVVGEVDLLVVPADGNPLLVSGKLPTRATREGNEERTAKGMVQIAEGILSLLVHLAGGLLQRGGTKQLGLAPARQVRRDLECIQAASGQQGDRGKFPLVPVGGRLPMHRDGGHSAHCNRLLGVSGGRQGSRGRQGKQDERGERPEVTVTHPSILARRCRQR